MYGCLTSLFINLRRIRIACVRKPSEVRRPGHSILYLGTSTNKQHEMPLDANSYTRQYA